MNRHCATAAAWSACALALLLAPATFAQPRWEPVGLSGGGGMFTPAFSPLDPDLVMLNCDMSAAYISENGGRDWRMVHHAQLRSDTRCRPALHPKDRDVIFASSGGRLKVSRDRGRTFSSIGDLREPLFGEIAIHPDDPGLLLVGSRRERCLVSRDEGRTFSVCRGPAGSLLGFAFDRRSGHEAIFAATTRGVWRSRDRGAAWSKADSGLKGSGGQGGVGLQGFSGGSDPRSGIARLYATVESRVEDGRLLGGIHVSSDGGESWRPVGGRGLNRDTRRADRWSWGPVAQYVQILTTDTAPLTVYAMNTSTGFHPPHHDTVYRSDDGGATWRDTFFMDPRFERYNVAPNWVTASCGQSYKGGDAPFGAAIAGSDPDRVILVRSQCYLTHDGGESWFNGHTYPAPGETPAPRSRWACNGLVVTTTWHHYVDPFEPRRHYIAYTDIGLARSTDGGETWRWWDKRSWAPWRNTCYEIAFDPEIPGKMWGAFSNVHDIPNDNIISERHGHSGPGGVCVSRDFGETWKVESEGLPARPVTSIVVDPRSPRGRRTLHAGVFGEGVYRSTDDGRTWILRRKGLGHATNRRVSRVTLHADGTLHAVVCARRAGRGQPLRPEGVGVHRSTDGGSTWRRLPLDPPALYPKDLTVHPKDSRRLLLGTCDAGRGDTSGGLWETRDGGQTWRRIGRQGPQTFGGYYHPEHDGWIYMTLTEGAPGAGLWLSRDDGRTWTPFAELPFSNVQRVELDPTRDDRMHVTTFGGSVWRGPLEPAPGSGGPE